MSSSSDKHQLPWTYSGLLDDAVARFPVGPKVDEEFLQRAILKNILFSGPILLNDGYIFHSDAATKLLLDPNSLLRRMLNLGFVRILSRGYDDGPSGFASIPEKLAIDGVNTSVELVSREDWPEIRGKIERLAETFFRENDRVRRISPWPKYATHVGMGRLFRLLYDRTQADLGLSSQSRELLMRILDAAGKSDAFLRSPRGFIEEEGKRLLKEIDYSSSSAATRSLSAVMNLANQAYHYNMAMCCTADMGQPVIADTTVGPAFEDFLEAPQLFELEMNDVPVIGFPKGIPLDHPSLFEALVEPGALSDKKIAFIHAISVLRASTDISSDEKGRIIRESILAYRSALVDHFASKLGKRDLSSYFTVATGVVAFAVNEKLDLLGVAGDVGALTIALLGANKKFSSFVWKTQKFVNRRLADVALDPISGRRGRELYHVRDVKPRFSSIAFSNIAVQQHIESVPRN